LVHYVQTVQPIGDIAMTRTKHTRTYTQVVILYRMKLGVYSYSYNK